MSSRLGGGVQSEMLRTLFLVPFVAVVPRFPFAPFLSPHNVLLARLLMALQLPLRLSPSDWRAMFNRTPNSRWGWWKCSGVGGSVIPVFTARSLTDVPRLSRPRKWRFRVRFANHGSSNFEAN